MRLKRAVICCGILAQRFDRAQRPVREFPTAIRALATHAREDAFGTKRTFERTNHRVARIGREVPIATLAVRFHEKHGGHLIHFRSGLNLIRHAPIRLRHEAIALPHSSSRAILFIITEQLLTQFRKPPDLNETPRGNSSYRSTLRVPFEASSADSLVREAAGREVMRRGLGRLAGTAW